MKFIFSTNQIESLANLPMRERAEKLQQAELKLKAPQKLALNLIKLLLFIPPFFFLAQQNWGLFVITCILAVVGKLVIFTPLKLYYLTKYL